MDPIPGVVVNSFAFDGVPGGLPAPLGTGLPSASGGYLQDFLHYRESLHLFENQHTQRGISHQHNRPEKARWKTHRGLREQESIRYEDGVTPLE